MAYGGQALTLVGAWNAGGTSDTRTEIWQLVNPPTGANNLTFDVSGGSGNCAYGITTFTNVRQTSPLGTAVIHNPGTVGLSRTVTVNDSVVGGLVYGGISANASAATANIVTLTDSASQTVLWNANTSVAYTDFRLTGAAGVKSGGGSVTEAWNFSENSYAALAAFAIHPSVTTNLSMVINFTQAPAFTLPFNMTSGASVSITNYINVISGSMPANPAITARLAAGGSTFLTLSNPTYNSGTGTLVWSGPLGGAVAVSAGQAISLSISNAQSGVEFQIRYDSSTYPSKIILPTASIIAVPSVAVYDAAYPGGTPVSTSPITSQRYVRFTVTDPFGAYDITGAGLVINGPGTAGDVNVALTDVQVVSSNAWSKTYEYVWPTLALSGSYALTVTANEGSEGITASGTTTEILYAASVGDFVWDDLDGDGQQDVGEQGLSNVVVRLYNTSNVVIGVTTSTVSGAYVFTDLLPGSYTLSFTPPVNYLSTTSNVGNDASDSDTLTGTNRTALVTLTSAQSDNTVDAGFYFAGASVAGFVRIDLNGNGVAETGDTNGIVGVTVQLLNAASNVVATATTAASGSYSFTGLLPGSYIVREIDLGGWYSTLDISAPNDNLIPVTLTIGQNSTGNIFHDTQRASIGNFVWNDLNGNGQQDSGAEANGLSNVVVRLYNTNSVVIGVATSTVTGAYAFTNLATGSYTVSFTPPANYFSTTSNIGNDASDSDPLAGTNRTALVTLTSGLIDNTVDAGFFEAASVAGFVRIDLNGNGVAEAGDTNGISGVTVQLLDAASNVVATATTAANGAYSFTNLRPGTYTVRETDLGGWYSTLDATAPNDNLIPVTLAIGQNSIGNIFHDTQRSVIGNFVWNDLNGNGQQDSGAETNGLGNVIVHLYDAGNAVIGVATSTVTGAYAFTNLAAGTYTVSFTPPANYLSTTSNVGNDASDSDTLAGTNRTAAVTLTSGQTDNSVDAGFYAAGSISGSVRIDLNGNGVAEAGDTNGIAGVTVQLLDAASNVVATATTAANGSYSFTNLRPGTYTVRETDLGGWYSTLDATAPNDNLIPVTLAIGQNSIGNIFHDTQRSVIGNFVWDDLNGNGQQDTGAETNGLGNVIVHLYDAGNAIIGVATSTVTGAYAFTNLAAGTYTLSFTPPANYLSTTSNVGNDATDSDPLTGTNRTAAITLTSGQVDNSVDAGFYAAGSIAGSVRIDLNGNGVAEAGDTNGISGVTVQLLDAASNVVATATTAANGAYSFTNLRPGTYTVRETDLGGWYSTLDATAPNDNLIPVTLAIGQISTNNIFHDTQRASIGDFVWNDLNGNGQQDGGAESSGLSNVVVRLYDIGNNVLDTTITDASGAYAFTNLLTGTYAVEFGAPANYLSTTSNVGNDATDSDTLPGTNRTAAITLASGQNESTVDAGFYAAASIAGFVQVDLNGNGVAEAGDINGIAGVTVQLLDVASNVVATATTAVDGSYSFADLRPGAYTVRETDLGGWYSTLDITAPNDNLIPVTLAIGQNSAGNNFHDAQPASLGDRVWNDLDGDGAQEAFEPGIANVRIYVDSNNSGTYDIGEPMTLTLADGSYQISSLLAGAYTARVDSATLPAGMTQTYDLNGVLDNAALVVLNSNQTRDDVDFGYRSTAVYAIRGQVRDDYDSNGAFSDPDLPVGGVLISLYSDPNGDGNPADGAVITSTRTAPDGSYAFTSLLSGPYVVLESDPTHSVSTADTVDANDNRIPVLIINADVLDRDFLDAVDPAGYLYDVADGRIVPGGSIVVSGPGSYVLMDGSSGQYMFIATNNAPGTYTISVTPPPDYVIDPTRPAQPGSFDPTGGPDPTVLGSYESATPQGFLVNYSAASNTFYYTFDLQPGDPPVINNNFPLKKIVLEVTGTVFFDLNRLTDNTVNGVGTDAGGLFANLVNPTTYMVIACVPVAANGTYRFTEADGVLANTSYVVILTQAVQPVSAVLTGATLPANWVSTGEHVGAGPGNDGMADSWLQASTTADGVREVNFGIVSVPDITPVITATPNVMTGVTDYEIYVQCIELKGINTSGLITLRIPKDPRWVMLPGWNPTFTQLPVSGLPVQNPLWTHTEDADTHFFTTTSTITGGSQATFGFQARWNAGQTRGSYTISVAIVPGSGGEDRINNNNDSETVNYSF
jgi:protocatechuate 3,4-dioxygenase beta subunit